MAQLAVSAAGAFLGNLILPGIGGQIGWALGGMLGSSLGPGVEGPRLSDLRLQGSSYGVGIPLAWGGVAIAGNVIWKTDLVEHESETGGKGGPSVTQFSYTASFAVALCQGVRQGVRRIWADAKLVYDITDLDDGAAQAASGEIGAHMVFYTGSEVQGTDPTMEAALGVGNVPGYRGTCYAVFTDLPLEAYGNRIPTLLFELTDEPEVEADLEGLAALEIAPWVDTALGPVHGTGGTEEYTVWDQDTGFISYQGHSESAAFAAMQATYGVDFNVYMGYYTSVAGVLSTFNVPEDASATLNAGNGALYVYLCYNIEPAGIIIYDGLGAGLCPRLMAAGATPNGNIVYMLSSLGSDAIGGIASGNYGIARIQPGPSAPPGYSSYVNNCFEYGPAGLYFPAAGISAHARIRVERIPSVPAQACWPGDPCELGIAQLPGNPDLCITCDGEVTPNFTYTLESGTFKQLKIAETVGETHYTWLPMGPVLRSTDPDYSSQAYWEAAAAAAGVTGTYGVNFPFVVSEVGASEAVQITERGAGSALLSDIVADICEVAGLGAAQIDVDQLTDVVSGYVVPKQMPARQAIEPLRAAFWFDAVESGREIRFVKRGGASAVTIEADELGAGDGDAAANRVESTRAQETELPSRVNVSYMARSREYETGTQSQRRMTTGSQQVSSIELPIVMTDQRGAEIADVLMYDAWVGRNRREFATTRKYARYEPTDIVTVDDGVFQYTLRVADKNEQGGLIQWVAVDDSPAGYSPNVIAAEGSVPGSAIRFEGPMKLELMDIPLLRDSDDDAGYYVGSAGYRPEWSGGRMYRSTDDGVNYLSIGDTTDVATLGYASTALGTFAGGNTFDELNTVTVRLHSGELQTVTRTQLLGGANAALLGDEVIQFMRATLTAALTYRLSGLLRARLGTDQHMATHAVDERFVLLDTRLARVDHGLSSIGLAAVYKGVTFGQALADANEIDFTNSGAGLKPLSPVHMNAAPLGGGIYRVTWVRRTRIGGQWRDNVDAALGEASESYSVEVFRSSVVSTTTVTSPTADVAAQTGDVIRVYQLSELVGRGFVASITVT